VPLVASNYSVTTAVGTAITLELLDEDSGYQGLPTITTEPANGSVTLSGSNATYTPGSGFTGVDTFVYSISDGNGHTATGC